MIINLGKLEQRGINVKGVGHVTLTNKAHMNEEVGVGKLILEQYPQLCVLGNKAPKVETKEVLLVEEPITDVPMEVEKIEENLVDIPEVNEDENSPSDLDITIDEEADASVQVKEVTEFEDASELKEYALTLGIELKGNKKLENLYKDFTKAVEAL